MCNGLEETLLFKTQNIGNTLLGSCQLGIGLTHFRHQGAHQRIKERGTCAQLVTMTDGTAHDPAQHIAAAFVTGNDAIDDEERASANMVRNHLQ